MGSFSYGPETFIKNLLLFSVIFSVFLGFSYASSTENHIYTISELCNNSHRKSGSRMIEGSVLTSVGERNIDCVITFQTDTILQHFMLRFEKLQLDCNDHLLIYDGAYTTSSYKADLSCRHTMQNVGTLYTHSNHVTLKYITDEYGPMTNGFRLIITAFKDKKNTCKHFRCQKTNFCVNRDLTCDGINHCGDNSDESTSLALCPSVPLEDILGVSRTWLFVGLIIFIILCILCVATIVLCVCRRNNPNRNQQHQQQQQQHLQQQQTYQMDMSSNYGTNGTFGSMVSDKPPPYPGAIPHTVVIPPGTSPGNPARPASGVGCSTLPPMAPTGHCGRRLG